MAIQLNPSKVPIWKNASELRLGIGEAGQELGEISNSQERLINLLFAGVAESQISLVGNSVGLSDQETRDLVQRLKPSLIQSSQSLGGNSLSNLRFAELMRIGFQTEQSPMEVVSNRGKQTVELSRLDRTGVTILKALSENGFKKFNTQDFELVGQTDLGELGYPQQFLGVSRINAARMILESEKPGIEITQGSRAGISKETVCVLSGMHRILPNAYRGLPKAFLAVEYRLDSLFVSRVTRLGVDPCLSCRDLWEIDTEPSWATESIQLTNRQDQLDDGVNLLMASSIAARNICSYVDSGDGLNTLVNLKNRTMREANWQRHEGCTCSEL
jgi:hypothetical protein